MRKVVNFVVPTEGRDKGKRFQITEMPAMQAEKWAMRAFLALAASGIDLPAGAESSGMAGIATAGLRALQGLPWGLAEPLIDELLTCVKAQPNDQHPEILMADLNMYVEEPATFLRLRAEAFLIHTSFSWGDVQSKLTTASLPVDAPAT